VLYYFCGGVQRIVHRSSRTTLLGMLVDLGIMTRSEAALKRRAEKRKVSLEEQRAKDNPDVNHPVNKKRKQEEDVKKKNDGGNLHNTYEDNPNNVIDPLKEDGSWICSACNNHNFASRRICNSKTCNQPRPGGNYGFKQTNNKHYKVVSKRSFNILVANRKNKSSDGEGNASRVLLPKLKWPTQAGPGRILYNQNLRERFKLDRTKLNDVELERALILIKRDERKKEKRLKQRLERDRKKEMKRIRKEKREQREKIGKKKD
jgi:hypothetical protein